MNTTDYYDDTQARIFLERSEIGDYAIDRLADIGYFKAPASRYHHLAEPCGLMRHSVNVTEWLLKLTDAGVASWKSASSPYRIGMLHDLVKCKCYAVDPLCGRDEPIRYVYRQSEYVGHGAASALIAMSVVGVPLLPVECACIVHHMGAYRLDDWRLKEYNAALDVYPRELIATHTADMLATRVDEV